TNTAAEGSKRYSKEKWKKGAERGFRALRGDYRGGDFRGGRARAWPRGGELLERQHAQRGRRAGAPDFVQSHGRNSGYARLSRCGEGTQDRHRLRRGEINPEKRAGWLKRAGWRQAGRQ